MKFKLKFTVVLLLLFISINLNLWFRIYPKKSNRVQEIEFEARNIKNSSVYTNVTIISDGYQDQYWNDHESKHPDIEIDTNGNIHIVWYDATSGEWGYDREIMYINYTLSEGWSNVTIISDGYQDEYWNDGESEWPSISITSSGIIHVVWSDGTEGPWRTNSNNFEIMYANYSSSKGWSNATVISDGYQGIYWNDARCSNPAIATENNGRIHVVWSCEPPGGMYDEEIMYVKYTPGVGWSNVSVISDGYGGIYWNDAYSGYASISVDYYGNAHVVWEDYTSGAWGDDIEIMYVKYTSGVGWSNVSIISDGYNSIYWNDDASMDASIDTDPNGNIHVVWEDYTHGEWGDDIDIMYVKYTYGVGWSNVSIISDGYNNIYWNDDASMKPSIVTDLNGNIHVVWQDYSNGIWGDDVEIMHVMFSAINGWSNVTVISDGYDNSYWNAGTSQNPSIDADPNGNIHIVWEDDTEGVWKQGVDDDEIMYSYADFLSPNISINSPRNDKIYGNKAPYFNITINEGNLNETWYSVYNGSVWSENYTVVSFFDQIDLGVWNNCPNGTIIVKFFANDTFGNYGSSEVIIRKDIIAPRISVIKPIDNNIYGSEPPNFNLSINESNLNETWYSIYNGTHWLQDIYISGFLTGQIDPGIWENCPNGNLNLRFFSNDLSGNINFSEIIIIKDTINPSIIINSPQNNSYWNVIPIINVTTFDTNFNSMWYSIGFVNVTLINNTAQELNNSIWNSLPEEGSFEIYIYANDSVGHLNDSYMLNLYKDIVKPQIIINNPKNYKLFSTDPPFFEVNITERYLKNVRFSLTGEFGSTYYYTWEGNITQEQWDLFSNGFVTITFYAEDYAGNIETQNIILIKKVGKWQILPLVIDDKGEGNFTWAEIATKAWCKGSGTFSDPYIIDDIIINGQNLVTCIEIRNSNAFFILSNSTFYNSSRGSNSAGIKLVEVINGKIINNNCSNNYGNGVLVELSQNITITNNEINNNKYAGILLYQCEFNLIYDNRNSINNNSLYGIYLDKSNNNTISNNTINANQIGVFLNDSFNNLITSNIFQGNEISILESESCVDKNIIYNNQDDNISNERNKIPDNLLIFFIIVIILSFSVLIIMITFVLKKYNIFPFKSTEMEKSIEEPVIESEIIPDLKRIIPPFTLFLSYSTLDTELFQIRKIVKKLEEFPEIHKVYYWEADSGENIVEYMERTLNKCNIFVLFCSQNALNSKAVRDEWQAAFQLRKKEQLKIVPVYNEEKFIPALLTPILNVKYIEDDFDAFIENFYKEILRQ